MTSHEVPSLHDQIAAHVKAAIARVRPELTDVDPLVRRSEHADFQSNAALALAKATRANPRQLADGIATELRGHAGDPIADVALSGPGFLNVTITDTAVWAQVATRLGADRLGVSASEAGRRTVIDYSAPNIAKEMHVGHLRTTIIGDSIARVLGFLGGDGKPRSRWWPIAYAFQRVNDPRAAGTPRLSIQQCRLNEIQRDILAQRELGLPR